MFLELRCTERIVKHCVVHIEIVRIRINRILGAKFRFGDRKSGQIMKVESGGGGRSRGSIFRPVQLAIMKGTTKSSFVGG